MNIYMVDCYSDCGTYFEPYLQEVIVIAPNEEQASNYAKEVYRDEFVSNNFNVFLLTEIGEGLQIVNAHYDSDY